MSTFRPRSSNQNSEVKTVSTKEEEIPLSRRSRPISEKASLGSPKPTFRKNRTTSTSSETISPSGPVSRMSLGTTYSKPPLVPNKQANYLTSKSPSIALSTASNFSSSTFNNKSSTSNTSTFNKTPLP